jgi:hypothetical protein
MSTTDLKPLWTCPKCGKRFVTRNMWHSCGRFSVEQFFKGKSPRAKKLYHAFHKFVRTNCGRFVVDVAKTRISFQGRVRFAGVAGVNKEGLTIGFWLKRRVESPRFVSVQSPMPKDFVYKLRVQRPQDFDRELARWLKEAYLVGQQRYGRE